MDAAKVVLVNFFTLFPAKVADFLQLLFNLVIVEAPIAHEKKVSCLESDAQKLFELVTSQLVTLACSGTSGVQP
jgi:hypothetical protein